jgi:hypothetical protein
MHATNYIEMELEMNRNTLSSVTKIKNDVIELVNGEGSNHNYPDTFWIPAKAEREALQIGAVVKIVADLAPVPERFWVEITKRTMKDGKPQFYGQLRSDLLAGYSFDSEIGPFEPKHIIQIWEGN